MPKTIYLEHSAFGFENWWDDLRVLSQNRNIIRFVLSDWNLIEIANGKAKRTHEHSSRMTFGRFG